MEPALHLAKPPGGRCRLNAAEQDPDATPARDRTGGPEAKVEATPARFSQPAQPPYFARTPLAELLLSHLPTAGRPRTRSYVGGVPHLPPGVGLVRSMTIWRMYQPPRGAGVTYGGLNAVGSSTPRYGPAASPAPPGGSTAVGDLKSTQQVNRRRRYDRFLWVRPIQVSWLRQGQLSTPITLVAQDLSKGGMSILSRSLVYPGTIGIVLLKKNNEDAILRCIRVAHCRYIGEAEHFVGASWLPMPSGLPISIRQSNQGPVLDIRETR